MNRRQDAKEETRRLILEAARELFWEIGVEACTMRRIATKAGVSAASVVVHFQSKTALLEAALSEAIEVQLEVAMAEIPGQGDLEDRLMHVPRHMLRFYDQDRDLYRTLIRDTIFEPPQMSPRLNELNERYLGWIARALEQERQRGVIKDHIDPTLAAAGMFCLYLGALTEFLRNKEQPVEQAVEVIGVMARQHLYGIMNQPQPAGPAGAEPPYETDQEDDASE